MEDQVLARIPQSPPYHAEGPTVLDRVKRMREVVAMAQAGELARLEELHREKTYRTDIRYLELVLAREADLFLRFSTVHALGAKEIVRYEAPRGSKGEYERVTDIDHYLKLARLATIGAQGEFAMTTFFDQYEIRVVDHGYARASARLLRREEDPRLELLVRLHEEWLDALRGRPGTGFFQSIERQVRKIEMEIDLVPALLLLLRASFMTYKEGVLRLDFSPLFTYLELEGLAGPRAARRKESLELNEKRMMKEILQEAGLLDETVFRLIGVTTLKERGKIMEEIRRAVFGGVRDGYPSSLAPIEDRIIRARDLLTKRQKT